MNGYCKRAMGQADKKARKNAEDINKMSKLLGYNYANNNCLLFEDNRHACSSYSDSEDEPSLNIEEYMFLMKLHKDKENERKLTADKQEAKKQSVQEKVRKDTKKVKLAPNNNLIEKNPVSLTPVIYNSLDSKCQKQVVKLSCVICSLCKKEIKEDNVTTKCSRGHSNTFHNECFDKIHISGIVMCMTDLFSSEHECISYTKEDKEYPLIVENKEEEQEKDSIEEQKEESIEEQEEESTGEVITEKQEQKEYSPSWRIEDVSEYEINKPKKNKKKKKTQKTKKYIEIQCNNGVVVRKSKNKTKTVKKEEAQKPLPVLAAPFYPSPSINPCFNCCYLPISRINYPCEHRTHCTLCSQHIAMCPYCFGSIISTYDAY